MKRNKKIVKILIARLRSIRRMGVKDHYPQEPNLRLVDKPEIPDKVLKTLRVYFGNVLDLKDEDLDRELARYKEGR
jgi:hypothetical protein